METEEAGKKTANEEQSQALGAKPKDNQGCMAVNINKRKDGSWSRRAGALADELSKGNRSRQDGGEARAIGTAMENHEIDMRENQKVWAITRIIGQDGLARMAAITGWYT